MEDNENTFPDLKSRLIKELYPEPDDRKLLNRVQSNWVKYNRYWGQDTKKQILY
jgi:hypothetical protein